MVRVFDRSGASAFRPVIVITAMAMLASCQSGGTATTTAAARGTPIEPERLMGLDESGVTALLGAPDLARSEADIRILQFHGGSCVADIYLYPGDGGGRTVTYTEARTTSGSDTDEATCLGAIAAGR